MKIAESDGVLLAASSQGILRSADDGKNWDRVISEGITGVAVERIDGGFAAIAYNIITKTNTIHISLDAGKTWNDIGQGPQPSLNSSLFDLIGGRPSSSNISAIKQAGKYLICAGSDGIFRSADRGKTWKLLLSSIDNNGFNISVSGSVIYAIPNKGC